jgi:dCMP deaminase
MNKIIQSSISWDSYFLNIVNDIGKKSKDPSTKIGCLIVDKENRIKATGYNGFPSKVIDYEERYTDRNQKLYFTEHAEKNAIFYAARLGISVVGCKIFIPLHPCHECCRGIIQSGIDEVIFTNDNSNGYYDRWRESIAYADIMFEEAGILLRKIDV